MSVTHSFSVKVATAVGERKAVILNNFAHWHLKNSEDALHVHEEHIWTFNSVAAYVKVWPYLSAKEIRTALDGLEADGWIITGNYNEWKSDRTKWYALTEKSCELLEIEFFPVHLTKRANAFDQTGKSKLPNGQMGLPSQSNGFAPEGKAIPLKDSIEDSFENDLKDSEPNGSFVESSVVDDKKQRKTSTRAKSPEDYKTVHRMRLYIESISPSYAWSAKEATAASQIENKLRAGIKKVNESKGVISDVTDDDVMNAFQMLIQRSYELPDFYQFSSVVKLNSNYNDVVERLRKPRQTNGTGKLAPGQQSDEQRRARVDTLFDKIDSIFGEV